MKIRAEAPDTVPVFNAGSSAKTVQRRAGRTAHLAVGIRSSLATVSLMRTAIYPGSFDPITNGHLDVIQRAAKLFDHVIVAIATNDSKTPLFSLNERRKLVTRAVKHLPNVEADAFTGLLVKYVEGRSGDAIIRGLRALSDFEFEFQLALMNRKLNERVETIFMMPRDTYTFISSRIVKEIARLDGDVTAFVPEHVQTALIRKFAKSSR